MNANGTMLYKTFFVHLALGILQTLGLCSPDCGTRALGSNIFGLQRRRVRKILLYHMHLMYYSQSLFLQKLNAQV